jgi:hypothetical protein
MLLVQQFHDFHIRAGLSRAAKTSLASLADAAKHQARLRADKIRDAGDHDSA